MAIARAALMAVVGVVAGALASWLLLWVPWIWNLPSIWEPPYLPLAIPFAIVAAAGSWLVMRRRARPLGIGIIVGTALETAFFVYLFAAIRGFDTFD